MYMVWLYAYGRILLQYYDTRYRNIEHSQLRLTTVVIRVVGGTITIYNYYNIRFRIYFPFVSRKAETALIKIQTCFIQRVQYIIIL